MAPNQSRSLFRSELVAIASVLAILAFVLLFVCASRSYAGSLVLGLPVACEIGKTCWVQNYVDHDPSRAVRDYACGGQTYDGHDGTDFRVANTTAKVAAIASAAGTVSGLRDGVTDRLMRSEADRAAVGNRECGNGVVIDHPNGWQTQYCHLRKGSITVKKGERIESGTNLGEVGYSGMAAFPHVHLTVRHKGKEVDPFGGVPSGGEECGPNKKSLWNAPAVLALAYRKGEVIQSGFNSAPIELSDLETGAVLQHNLDAAWPALVAYVWAINLAAGDRVTVILRGPGGIEATNSTTLDRNKAVYMLFAGKKQPADGWPSGEYIGSITVANAGEVRLFQTWKAGLQ